MTAARAGEPPVRARRNL